MINGNKVKFLTAMPDNGSFVRLWVWDGMPCASMCKWSSGEVMELENNVWIPLMGFDPLDDISPFYMVIR